MTKKSLVPTVQVVDRQVGFPQVEEVPIELIGMSQALSLVAMQCKPQQRRKCVMRLRAMRQQVCELS